MIKRFLRLALAPLAGLAMIFGVSTANAFTVDCWDMEGVGTVCVIAWIRSDGTLGTIHQVFQR